MGDDPKPSVVQGTIEAATGLVKAVPVYQDAVQPLAQEVGKTLPVPLQVVNAALRPLQTMMKGWNLIWDALDQRLAEKLRHVPPEKIVEPPRNVAGPLMLHYGFVADDTASDLREL